jgi:5-methylcytosine-specific restriction protein A
MEIVPAFAKKVLMKTDALTRKLYLNYRRAGQEAGYWGHYFLRELKKHGGLEVARRILVKKTSAGETKGFLALAEAGRQDLSVEAIVLSPRFRRQFTSEELATAERRLKRFPPSPYPDELPDGRRYSSGAVARVLVNRYERSPKARAACLAKHGRKCIVCRLALGQRYGHIGKGFIHVHHLKPLSATKRSYRLDPATDLVPVCPNCHAMLHRRNPPFTVNELRARLK